MIDLEVKRITDRSLIMDGIEFWNGLYPSFSISQQLLGQNIFAPFNHLAVEGLAGFIGGEMVALGLCKYLLSDVGGLDPGEGWISLLGVKNLGGRQEEAEDFLGAAENLLQERGVTRIRFAGDPQCFFPGLPRGLKEYEPILTARDFQPVAVVYDLYRDLQAFQPAADWLRDDLKLRRVGKEREKEFLKFLQDNFPPRWYYEADSIRRWPGGIEDYRFLSYQGEIAGFARINKPASTFWGPNMNWGWKWGVEHCGLGPLGIGQGFRGRGMSLFLIAQSMMELQAEGFRHLIVDWTDQLDFYARFGLNICQEYTCYRKELQ